MLSKEKLDSLDAESIKTISWEDLLEKYDLDEVDIKAEVRKAKHSCANFWTPNHDDYYTQEEVEKVKELFKEKFEDIEIKSEDNYSLTEIYLNSVDKHLFKYSIIEAFNDENSDEEEQLD